MLSKAEVAAIRERARREKNDHGVLLVPAGEFHAALDTIEAFAEALEEAERELRSHIMQHHPGVEPGNLAIYPYRGFGNDEGCRAHQILNHALGTYHSSPTEGESVFENRVRRFGPGAGGWSGHSLSSDASPTEGGTE